VLKEKGKLLWGGKEKNFEGREDILEGPGPNIQKDVTQEKRNILETLRGNCFWVVRGNLKKGGGGILWRDKGVTF